MAEAPKTELINVAQLTGDEKQVTFVVHAGGADKRYPMRAAVMKLGRSDQADIVIKDASVSSRHLEFAKDAGQLVVRDQGSSNGTFLNGDRISEAVLSHGDVLRVGASVTISVEIVDAGRAAPEPPPPPRRAPRPQPASMPPAPMPMALPDPPPPQGRGKTVIIAAAAGVLVLAAAVVGALLYMNSRARAADRELLGEIGKKVGALVQTTPCSIVQESVAALIQLEKNAGVEQPSLPPSSRQRGAYERYVSVQRDKARQYARIINTVEQFAAATQISRDAVRADLARIKDEALRTRANDLAALLDERGQLAEEFIGGWRRLQNETGRYADLTEAVFVNGAGDANAFAEFRYSRPAPQVLGGCRKSYEQSKKSLEEKVAEIVASAGK